MSKIFHPSIYKSNLKRMWILPVLYGIGLVVFSPYLLSRSIKISGYSTGSKGANEIFAGYFQEILASPWLSFIVCIICAISVFSYLYRTRDSYMIHAFPVDRRSLFLTAVGTGFTMLTVPKLFVTIVTNIYTISVGAKVSGYLWGYFFEGVLIDVFFFGLASAVALCCGRTLSALITYVAANFLYVLLKEAIYWLIVKLRYGVVIADNDSFADVLTPTVYMDMKLNGTTDGYAISSDLFSSMKDALPVILVYALVGILFFGVAYVIYKYRHLETAGSFLSMEWTKPIVRWVGAIGTGVYLVIFVSVFESYDSVVGTMGSFAKWLLLILLFTAIAFIVFQMLIDHTLKVFSPRRMRELGLFAVCVCAVMVWLYADPLKNADHVPDPADIKNAAVAVRIDSELNFSEKADIEKITDFHKQLNREKKDSINKLMAGKEDHENVQITYTLSNGKLLIRSYEVWTGEEEKKRAGSVYNKMDAALSKPEQLKIAMFGKNYSKRKVREVDVPILTGNETVLEGITEKKKAAAVYEAVLRDIDEGNIKLWDQNNSEAESFIDISFDLDENDIKEDGWIKDYVSITIGEDAVNTKARLKEYGYN
ncbi:MAG: hypothetical protein K6F00_02395 [Lachnospiraceae bacterium]|nr:hypothetical protein [Lachnospiraceae bacterium]